MEPKSCKTNMREQEGPQGLPATAALRQFLYSIASLEKRVAAARILSLPLSPWQTHPAADLLWGNCP